MAKKLEINSKIKASRNICLECGSRFSVGPVEFNCFYVKKSVKRNVRSYHESNCPIKDILTNCLGAYKKMPSYSFDINSFVISSLRRNKFCFVQNLKCKKCYKRRIIFLDPESLEY